CARHVVVVSATSFDDHYYGLESW
nr:immunoglobulin heavy chain junction region [Macaca mulatta]